MAEKLKKNEKFQARFDGQTRFALELLSAQRGQKFTRVVEDALIKDAKEVARVELGQDFSTLWHEHEGVRTLNLFACPGYKISPDEDVLRSFVLAHKEFFYADPKATIPQIGYVLTLWDHVQHYLELWRSKRSENYFVAAEAMEAALKKAKIKPPAHRNHK
jgi:hypothetical protein